MQTLKHAMQELLCLLPFEFNWFEHVFVNVQIFTNVDFNVDCSKDIMQ
jgi:hypothetical protein